MHVAATELVEEGPDLENGFEWIDGQIVEKPSGAESAFVSGNLFRHLWDHVEMNSLGVVFLADLLYQLGTGPSRRLRRADVSFVARTHFPDGRLPRGNPIVAPELAVETICPEDKAEDLEQRMADFLAHGTRLFWIVYPATRSVWVLRKDGSGARLTEAQELSGEDVVPGFSCPIATLFAGL